MAVFDAPGEEQPINRHSPPPPQGRDRGPRLFGAAPQFRAEPPCFFLGKGRTPAEDKVKTGRSLTLASWLSGFDDSKVLLCRVRCGQGKLYQRAVAREIRIEIGRAHV